MKQHALELRTPEGVSFSLPLAGPVARLFAGVLDLMVVAAAASILGKLASVFGFAGQGVSGAIYVLGYFVLSIGYGMTSEWLMRGQTLGKRVLQLRVVDEGGGRLEPNQVILRNLLRAVDSFPALYLVGGIALVLSPRSQRLGDLAASTVVVRTARTALPELDGILSVKYNSLRAYPHLAARLRQRLSPQEASLGLMALSRRKPLDPEARVKLFGELAEHYREIVRFPEESTEVLADEQYVRNVVDLVYRPDRAPENSSG